jgi:hypothetical protein
MLEESPHQAPLDAVCQCLLKLISRYETKESIIVDRLLRSTEALRARKQAIYVDMEQTLLGAMCELWPEPKRRASLRIVAMVSIGAMRLAMETWRQENGQRPLAKCLRESFAALRCKMRLLQESHLAVGPQFLSSFFPFRELRHDALGDLLNLRDSVLG